MDVMPTTRNSPSAAVPTASATMWRYPEAVAIVDGGEWWVDFGIPSTAEGVRPAGLVHDPEWHNQPIPLHLTLHEMVEDLRYQMTLPDPQAAEGLARHVQMYAGAELCASHGLPIFHDNSIPSCPNAGRVSTGHAGFKVADMRRLVNFLDGLRDATDRLTRQRRGLTLRIIEDIVGYALFPEWFAAQIRAELARDGHLSGARSRQVVTMGFDLAMIASGLHLRARWPRHRRPQLMLVAASTVAAYVADTLAHVGGDSTDRSYVCSSCGLPFTPKRTLREGEGRYCSRVECQRERERVKKARQREGVNQRG